MTLILGQIHMKNKMFRWAIEVNLSPSLNLQIEVDLLIWKKQKEVDIEMTGLWTEQEVLSEDSLTKIEGNLLESQSLIK